MRLRNYVKDDAAVIVGWIRSEEEFYLWSADRFNRYPITGEDLHGFYLPQMEKGRFFPFIAEDDDGSAAGHFFIRYPREDDDGTVRFGFVVVDPALRGKGYGKEILRLGTAYVKEHFSAARIELGVFVKNEKARYCYEAVGFRAYGRSEYVMPVGRWQCIEMEMDVP